MIKMDEKSVTIVNISGEEFFRILKEMEKEENG